MGTSKSSDGAPSGVPIVPPWVPAPPTPDDPSQEDPERPDDPTPKQPQQSTQGPDPLSPPIAPRGRFGPARTSLGRFGASGSVNAMRRGIAHYVRKGLGGSTSAWRRFGGSARTAGTLYGALSSTAAGQPSEPGSPLDPALLAGRSAPEVMDAVVEAVRPVDGTQDTEASRRSIRNSLADLLERFPEADLLNLAEEQRLFAVERFLSEDVYHRVNLDVGNAVRDSAPSSLAALSRLREIRDYIRQAVAARFRGLRATRAALTTRTVSQMSSQALREVLAVFEDYLK